MAEAFLDQRIFMEEDVHSKPMPFRIVGGFGGAQVLEIENPFRSPLLSNGDLLHVLDEKGMDVASAVVVSLDKAKDTTDECEIPDGRGTMLRRVTKNTQHITVRMSPRKDAPQVGSLRRVSSAAVLEKQQAALQPILF